jgi:hypothetical protein
MSDMGLSRRPTKFFSKMWVEGMSSISRDNLVEVQDMIECYYREIAE